MSERIEEFTPGPWKYDAANDEIQAPNGFSKRIVGYVPNNGNNTANAALIAASPQLYEVCKLIFHATSEADIPGIQAAAIDAMKKARGEWAAENILAREYEMTNGNQSDMLALLANKLACETAAHMEAQRELNDLN